MKRSANSPTPAHGVLLRPAMSELEVQSGNHLRSETCAIDPRRTGGGAVAGPLVEIQRGTGIHRDGWRRPPRPREAAGSAVRPGLECRNRASRSARAAEYR